MEKRAILAAMLMVALLLVYQILFIPQQDSKQPQAPPKSETPAPGQGSAPSATSTPAPPPSTPVPPLPAKGAPAPPERIAVVDTPLYRAEIASRGGQIRGWELKYRGQKPMVVADLLASRGLEVARSGQPPHPVAFALSTDSVRLDKDRSQGELRLVGEDGFGLRITQTLRFRADSYVVEQEIKVENRHSVAQSAQIVTPWSASVLLPKGATEKFQGQHPIRIVEMSKGTVRREVLAKTVDQATEGQWVALESEWYLAALIPRSPGFQLVEAKRSESKPGEPAPLEFAQVALQASLPALQPGQGWEGRAELYLGPKEHDRLKALGVGLEKSIFFGGFPVPQAYGGLPMEWITVPILWVMHLFFAYTHNYGIAIILLTVVTKVLFFPLTVKSMSSMKAMQALQPQINALRSKYKNDPQRLQQETMALYREHKVNPLGGCLPMIVQIPIFYALYVALSVAVEIQNAPFIHLGTLPAWFPWLGGQCVWICDLASQDPTYVLPILMGISMFIQQKMTPVMGDPRQAKMMLFMPILFTFMFLNLPSGLVLYWTLSNVLQIAQQKYMERSAKVEKAPVRVGKKG
jgi:YidC/Oxa1 family membrane protein insertase